MKLHFPVRFGVGKGVQRNLRDVVRFRFRRIENSRKASEFTKCFSVLLLEILDFVEAVVGCRYGLNVRR